MRKGNSGGLLRERKSAGENVFGNVNASVIGNCM